MPAIIMGIVKALLFVTATIFILCMPLGDPDEQCGPDRAGDVTTVMLCDVHRYLTKAVVHTGSAAESTIEFLACVIKNALYDSKIKFYSMLDKFDGKDLCRSIHCLHEKYDCDESSTKRKCQCRNRCYRSKN